MKKTQFYVVICLAFIVTLMAIFGTMNRYNTFYDLTSYKEKHNKKPNNNNNNPKPNPNPTPNPDPNPNPNPNPDPTPGTDKDLNGYECKSENCSIADNTSVINNKFEFVKDGNDNIILYNISEKKDVNSYKSVEPAGDSYVVENSNGLYGIIKVLDTVTPIMESKYKKIKYNESDGTFVITSDRSSFITDKDGKRVSSDYTADIIQYNERYIVTKSSNNEYHIFNFNNKEFLTEYYNEKSLFIELVGDYVGVITSEQEYRVYDFTPSTKLIGSVSLDGDGLTARARIVNNKIEIYDGENVLKTIDL